MKKYFKFFFMAAAMFVSMMFASCSKDEGNFTSGKSTVFRRKTL